MNQKEINELRRRFRPEKSAISRVYGCYVNSSKEIVSDLDESLGMMPQEESEKYLSLLKKGLSGSLGKNLIDIVFSTQQVVDSEEHRLLTTLRDSQLKDNEARQTFYHKVIDSLDMGDSSYLLLLTCDSYDVPHRGKDDSLQADASDEVFTYIVCVVCPIKEGKVELGYFPGDNEFHCAAGQTVAPPELGFLFPAFDDRAANIYNALFYSRKANEIHQEFIDAIFHVEAPMSAVEQKEAFQSALSDAFDCSLEVMQTVHEQLREKIKEHRESRSSEPLEMSASEIVDIADRIGRPINMELYSDRIIRVTLATADLYRRDDLGIGSVFIVIGADLRLLRLLLKADDTKPKGGLDVRVGHILIGGAGPCGIA